MNVCSAPQRPCSTQLSTAIKVTTKGGSCFCKLFTSYTTATAEALYLASTCFEEITAVKPRLRGQLSVRSSPSVCVCCPITLELLEDPVIAADGHTYTRRAIEDWLKENNTSPKTGVDVER